MNANPAPKQKTWINNRTASKIIPLDSTQPGTSYPSAEQQEQQLVGAILAAGELGKGNEMFRRVKYLNKEDFFSVEVGSVWRAFERIVEDNRQIDLITVESELANFNERGQNLLNSIGGKVFLLRLMQQAGANIESYAQDVLKASVLLNGLAEREKLGKILARGMSFSMHELGVKLGGSMQEIQTRLNAFNQRNTASLDVAIDSYMDRAEAEANTPNFTPGILTGYPGFDKVTLGLAAKKLYIFAAPPGWGKTAWLLCLALICLKQGKKVLFLSLEMSIDEMVERMICISARIDYSNFRKRKWSSDERAKIQKERANLKGLVASKSFTMVEMRKPTLAEIEAKLIDHQINPGYDVVFIDYIAVNKLTMPQGDTNESAVQIGSELERWKQTYPAAFAVATQMNRSWSKRKAKKPELEDLYYGSSIGFGADFVGFIYHESKVKPKSPNKDAEIIVRKNRCGPDPRDVTISLGWKGEWLLFFAKTNGPDVEEIEQEDDDE